MARGRGEVTGAELAVLEVLWQAGPSTIRLLTERLYPSGGAAHYATVQKLLERLGDKGCVRRRRQGRGHLYSAAVERGDLIARRLQETAARLCGGSLTPLLTQLVDSRRLSADEIRQLRELVDRLEAGGPEEEGR